MFVCDGCCSGEAECLYVMGEGQCPLCVPLMCWGGGGGAEIFASKLKIWFGGASFWFMCRSLLYCTHVLVYCRAVLVEFFRSRYCVDIPLVRAVRVSAR